MKNKNYLEKRKEFSEFSLSNQLIESKYSLSALSKDLIDIALTRIEQPKNPNAPLCANLYNIDIYKILGENKKNNIKRELLDAKTEIQTCGIVIDDEKGGFDSYIIAPTCRYHEGVFTIEFNSSLRNHTLVFENRNYTKCSIVSSTMLHSFKTKRIYEILKKEYYRLNPKNLNEYVIKTINLSELRFILGLADIKEQSTQKYIESCKEKKTPVDWDYCYNKLCQNKKYDRWTIFKNKVLDVAQKEIEKFAEIKFTYTTLKGKSNKVVGIEFKIFPNVPSEEIIKERKRILQIIEENESDFYKQQDTTEYLCRQIMDAFPDHYDKFGKEEIYKFLEEADGDEELVRWAIMNTDQYALTNQIYSYNGAVIDRIRYPQNYKNNAAVVNGTTINTTVVEGVMHDYSENKENIALKVWEKAKEKPEFKEFVDYLAYNNLTLEMFEELTDPKDYFAEYVNWRNLSNESQNCVKQTFNEYPLLLITSFNFYFYRISSHNI